jgi:hypothetical protein
MRQDGGCVWVTLSQTEMQNASNVGVVRHHESTKRNSKASGGFVEDEFSMLQIHIQGAMGEVCVAKVLDLYYDGSVNTYSKADIGTNIQVRATLKHNGFLRVVKEDEKDNPDHYYFLVTGYAPYLCVRGWMKGLDAKSNEKHFWSMGGRPPYFFIPQNELHPVFIKKRNEWNPEHDLTIEPTYTRGDSEGKSSSPDDDRLWP